MGCVSSQPEDVTKPAQIVKLDKQPPKPAKPEYETAASASLVDGEEASVPYAGLLLNSGALNLQRTGDNRDGKGYARAMAESDGEGSCVRGVSMSMPYVVIVGREGCEERVEKVLERVFADANNVVNGWNENSEIAKLNKEKPGKVVKVSQELASVFELVDEVVKDTEGRFDPTTGVLNVAFENCIKERGRPPLPAEVSPLKFAIGWKKLERKKGGVEKSNGNMVIDLDGIAKGYVIDSIVEELKKEGFEDCYVDWAGDIRTSGRHPSGREWRAGVMRPPELKRVFENWKTGKMKEMLKDDDLAFVANFGESGCAIATSGDYFAVQKYGFHHIAKGDSLSVMKANGKSVGTVSVVATTCAIADAVATAAMTADSVQEAVDFLDGVRRRRKDVLGYCVIGREDLSAEDRVYFTEGVFRPVETEQDTQTSSDETSAERKDWTPLITQSVAVNRYKVQFGTHNFEIDNFIACSMHPEQIVTMVVPKRYVENLDHSDGPEESRLSVEVLTNLSASELGKFKSAGINAMVRIQNISQSGSVATVIGIIEEVKFAAAQPVGVVFKDTILFGTNSALQADAGKVNVLPLAEQTKLMFRHVPSMMWVVSTKPPFGGEVAFTGTSVSVPQCAENFVYFNVAHSSVFYAVFGGVGSRVKVYGLSTEQRGLAEKYVKIANVGGEGAEKLRKDAMVTLDCTVEGTENVQDHLVVMLRIEECTESNVPGLMPLIWQDGKFAN